LNLTACARVHNLHGISVVIPMLNDDKRVKFCLGSLLDQTLNLDLVEIVLVRNFTSEEDYSNPLDTSIQTLLDRFIHVQVISCEPGNSNASNAGIEAAKFKYLTIIDCDDFVSSQFLELLLRGIDPADPTHAVLSPIIDLNGIFNRPQIQTIPRRTMQERRAGHWKISADSNWLDLRMFTTQITAKFFHTHVFCEEKFDVGLTVGMDTELNARLIRSKNVMSVSTSARGCYYFRRISYPSMSRPTTRDYKFSVTDRISLITSLVPDFLERDSLSVGIISSQSRYIKDYVDTNKGQRSQVIKDFADAGFNQNFIAELIGSDESTVYP
jgi:glycosyltransferase involved in cell wall biosynthesis